MDIQCYHLVVVKMLVRRKIKGDPRIALTWNDRKELVDKNNKTDKVSISESHIQKVLSNSPNAPHTFNQHTMNELARYVGFADWNALLRHYPLPPDVADHTGKITGKARRQLEEKVCKMLLLERR